MAASVFGRRAQLGAIGLTAALTAMASGMAFAQAPDRAAIQAQVTKRHDTAVKALQDWIALPSIAAEDRNAKQGAEYMAKLAREAGFQKVEIVDTGG